MMVVKLFAFTRAQSCIKNSNPINSVINALTLTIYSAICVLVVVDQAKTALYLVGRNQCLENAPKKLVFIKTIKNPIYLIKCLKVIIFSVKKCY